MAIYECYYLLMYPSKYLLVFFCFPSLVLQGFHGRRRLHDDLADEEDIACLNKSATSVWLNLSASSRGVCPHLWMNNQIIIPFIYQIKGILLVISCNSYPTLPSVCSSPLQRQESSEVPGHVYHRVLQWLIRHDPNYTLASTHSVPI